MTETPSPPDLFEQETWRTSPAWTVFIQSGLLFLSGGADEIYAVDEAKTPEVAQRLHEAWHAQMLDTLKCDADCQAAVRQLRRVGAIVSAEALCQPTVLTVRWFGQPNAPLLDRLREQTRGTLDLLDVGDSTDSTNHPEAELLIRTTASWAETIADYRTRPLDKPQLWIDCAYHHTFVIGPYIVPQETACVHCLANRVAHRWGDAPRPPEPAALRNAPLIAAVLASQLSRNLEQPGLRWVHLIERSLSLDLDTLQTQSSRVYRLPWCPVCQPAAEPPLVPPLPLPW